MFRIDKFGMPASLFHATAGSKSLSLNKILEADHKMVTNPGGGKLFLSGWHVTKTVDNLRPFFKRFKHPEELVVCRVIVDDFREKVGSKCLLADKMLILSEDWQHECMGVMTHTKVLLARVA